MPHNLEGLANSAEPGHVAQDHCMSLLQHLLNASLHCKSLTVPFKDDFGNSFIQVLDFFFLVMH